MRRIEPNDMHLEQSIEFYCPMWMIEPGTTLRSANRLLKLIASYFLTRMLVFYAW